MKKTWKERLYDVSSSSFVERYIPFLSIGLGITCIACSIVTLFLPVSVLVPAILLCLAVILPIAVKVIETIFEAVRSYSRETFLCNKVRHALFANEWIVSLVAAIILSPIFVVIVDSVSYVYIQRASSIIGAWLAIAISVTINKPISKYFKKKLVYVENENANVKNN